MTTSPTPQITAYSFHPVDLGCRKVCLDSTGAFKVHMLTPAGWEPQEIVAKDEELAEFHITMTGPHHHQTYYTVVADTGAQRLEVFGDEHWHTVYRWSVRNDLGEWLIVPAAALSLHDRCHLLMQMGLQVTPLSRR
jgi:hypothetical protein